MIGESPPPGSAAWRAWLETALPQSFKYGGFTARREVKGGRGYWYAYRKRQGRLRKAYCGRTDDLTPARLEAVAAQLSDVEQPAVVAGQLPLPPTPLLGRERELTQARDRVLDPTIRLLTLTGTGGTGKTRLAIAVAHGVREHFADGVWFIDLSPISDAALVVHEIARHLGIVDSGERPARDRLFELLAKRQALLLLDNMEQVVGAAADLAVLLDACRGVTLLVTSREPLHLRVEYVLPVPPLDHRSAMELFVRRADAVGGSIAQRRTSDADVAALVDRLDGLPLAIELAAARSRLLGPRAMLDRLNAQMDVLHAAEPDRPTRHHSLRAAIGWSFDLLDDAERRAFARLAVFVGGCDLQAAETVLGDVASPLELLASLIDKSLLRSEPQAGGDLRLRMLETIRAFALEQLAPIEADETRRRHARYFLDQFKPTTWQALDLPSREWLARAAEEHDNIRAALRWALDGGDAQLALELATTVQRFWLIAGHLREGLAWMEEAIDQADQSDPLVAAWALHAAGQLAWRQADYDRAESSYERGVALRRQLGDPFGVAIGLQGLASVARERGDVQRAIALWQECLDVFRAAGHKPRTVRAMLNLGISLYQAGEAGQATTLLRDTVNQSRAIGQTWVVATALTYVALIALEHDHDQVGAAAAIRAGLELVEQVGDGWVTTYLLELAARLEGDPSHAARLFEASTALRERMGAPLHPAFAQGHALREAQLAHVARDGSELSQEDAVQLALKVVDAVERSRPGPAPQVAANVLSSREREVASLVARGLTGREIAERLTVGERTVETHVDHIRAKLGLRSRAQIAVWAVEAGLAVAP